MPRAIGLGGFKRSEEFMARAEAKYGPMELDPLEAFQMALEKCGIDTDISTDWNWGLIFEFPDGEKFKVTPCSIKNGIEVAT